MNNLKGNCCVCLNRNVNLKPISNSQPENETPVFKLRSCVSEIDWKESYLICDNCSDNLETTYAFRRTCLDSDNLRKQQVPFDKSGDDFDAKDESISDSDDVCSTNSRDSDVFDVATGNTRVRKTIRFSCEHCDSSFNTSTKLVAHASQVHKLGGKDVKPFQCSVCSNRFATSSNLLQHLKYHDGSRTQICTFCGKSYITKNDLLMHEKQHLNKREYKCDSCPKCFNTHKDLRSHKLVVHSDPNTWNYVCDICDKKFPIKSNYDGHMRRHKGERRFACHLCEKKFIDKCVLQKHFRSHSNVRAFECSVCKKQYKDKRVMEIHKAKVHGIGDIKVPVKVKKYFCHICPKSYFAKNKLMRHLCSHTGERPYFCRICEKKFSDKSYVKQHMKKIHNVIENEIDAFSEVTNRTAN